MILSDLRTTGVLAVVRRGLRPLFSAGFVVSKPPRSPPTFWHQDWWAWDDPASYMALVMPLRLVD